MKVIVGGDEGGEHGDYDGAGPFSDEDFSKFQNVEV